MLGSVGDLFGLGSKELEFGWMQLRRFYLLTRYSLDGKSGTGSRSPARVGPFILGIDFGRVEWVTVGSIGGAEMSQSLGLSGCSPCHAPSCPRSGTVRSIARPARRTTGPGRENLVG
jgi:hypothetical protein